MATTYRSDDIRQLRDSQVRFAPRDRKIDQINRAEKLLTELLPDREYTFEYISFRITEFRPESAPQVSLASEDVAHDLRLFIEEVSDSADLAPEDVTEEVYTMDDLCEMFKVSTKTVTRWRRQGLVSRRFLFDGRKKVGFLHSSVERFVATNRERVSRGQNFSQLTDDQRHDIIDRARRLTRAGGCPAEVARRLADKTGRSVETIRYTIRKFDEENPDLAVFVSRMKLTEEAKQKIYTDFRRGTSAEALAKQYCRTRTTINRVVNEMRAKRILELPLEFMPNNNFSRAMRVPSVDALYLGEMPVSDVTPRKSRVPDGLPSYLAALYDVPLLTKEQEQHLFRKYNYLKYKATRLRKDLDPANAKVSLMNKIEKLYEQAVAAKNQIVRANLRLVVSIAKRHIGGADEFFDLISDGNMSLMRAVEKFDYGRGFKFSTYASWAIMKNFARTIPQGYKHRERFRSGLDETFGATPDERGVAMEEESAQLVREEQIRKILSRLDEREQKIIIHRFGLDYSLEPQTLKEVGAVLGVSKERVRQIETRAMAKLREAAAEEKIETPD